MLSDIQSKVQVNALVRWINGAVEGAKSASGVAGAGVPDPGPLVSDMDLALLNSFYSYIEALQNQYSWVEGAYLPVLMSPPPPSIEEILSNVMEPAWVPVLIHNQTAAQEMKMLALQSVALDSIDSQTTTLADTWPYELAMAYWKLSSPGITGWQDSASSDAAQYTAVVHTGHSAQQTISIQGVSQIDSIRLLVYSEDASDKFFDVTISSASSQTTGTCKYQNSTLAEVYLARALSVTDSKITITINAGSTDVVLYALADENSTFYMDGSPVHGYSFWTSVHSASVGPTGGTLTGVKTAVGIDTNIHTLAQNAASTLDGQTSIHPERFSDFQKLIILATAFNSTTNATSTLTEVYSQKSGTTVGADLMNSRVNVYITGSDSTASNLLYNMLEGADNINPGVLDATQLESVLVSHPRGILVVTGAIYDTAFRLDKDGTSLIASWLATGNQIVTVGDAPLENVYNGLYEYSTYAHLTDVGTSSGSQYRLVEPTSFDQPTQSTSVKTYQSGAGTNSSKTITLGGGSYSDYIQLTTPAGPSGGSLTFVFAMSVPSAQLNVGKYLRFDIQIDGVTVLEDVSMDSFRDPNTGLGTTGETSEGTTRMYVQWVGDILQDGTNKDADYIVYLTTDLAAPYGTHIIRILDKTRNTQGSQDIRVLCLNNIEVWESANKAAELKYVTDRYAGLPYVGAGLSLLTPEQDYSEPVLTSADALQTDGIPLYSAIGYPTAVAQYGVNLNQVNAVHVYSRDSSGKYGEATFRTNGGLVTVLSPVTDEDMMYMMDKVVYVLTGQKTGLVDTGSDGNINSQLIEPTLENFRGLTAYVTPVESQTRMADVEEVDVDFKADGRFGTSFSQSTALTRVNSVATYDSDNSQAAIATALPEWAYVKKQTLVGSSGAGTGYQVCFTIKYGNGTDSGNTMYCFSKCNRDFSDIRFVNSNGTVLNYWLQSFVEANTATFWVQIPDSLDTNKDVYVFYGNPNAVSDSFGYSTFGLFDDFNRGYNSTSVGNSWTEDKYSTGTLRTTGNVLNITQNDNYYCHIEKVSPSLSNFVLYGKLMYASGSCDQWRPALFVYWSQYAYVSIGPKPGSYHSAIYDNVGTIGTAYGGTVSANTWYYYRINATSTNVYAGYSTDGITWVTILTSSRQSSWSGPPSLILVGKGYSVSGSSYPNSDLDNNYGTAGSVTMAYADDVFMAKYTATEPSHGAWSTVNGYGIKVTSVGIDGTKVKYLLLSADVTGTKVNVTGYAGATAYYMGFFNVTGIHAFSIPVASIDTISLVTDPSKPLNYTGFTLYWMQTANVPCVPSPEQALSRAFENTVRMSAYRLETGNSWTVSSGQLTIAASYQNDPTEAYDADGILINLKSVARGPGFVLEIAHYLNSTNNIAVYASLYTGLGATGDRQDILLTSSTSLMTEQKSVTLYQVGSIVLSVRMTTTASTSWTIKYVQLVSETDMCISFEVDVPLATMGSGSYYYQNDSLYLQTTSSFYYSVTMDWLNVRTLQYPYVSMSTTGQNISVTELDLYTSQGWLNNTIDFNAGTLVNLTSYDRVIQKACIRIKSDGTKLAKLAIDTLVFSVIPKQIMLRHELSVAYQTVNGLAQISLAEHLLSWTEGYLAFIDGTEVVTRANTTISYWEPDCLIVQQVAKNHAGTKTFNLTVTIFNDGYVEIQTQPSTAKLLAVLSGTPDAFSDSYMVVRNTSQTVTHYPVWAALYTNSSGFALLSLNSTEVTANSAYGWMTVGVIANDNIVLSPILAARFTLTGGYEIDGNFYSLTSDLSVMGYMTQWTGIVDSMQVAMWDGSFNVTYAVNENFDDLGSWIIDDAHTTPSIHGRSILTAENGYLNLTISCNTTSQDKVALRLNYLSFVPNSYPFFGIFTTSNGAFSVNLCLGFSDGTNVTRALDTDGIPSQYNQQYLNLVRVTGSSSAKTVTYIELVVKETSNSTMANKTLLIDWVGVWKLNDWDMVSTTQQMTDDTVAIVNSGVLTMQATSAATPVVIKLRYNKLQSAFNSTRYRIFSYRARVGYASTVSVTDRNSTVTYNLNCSSVGWSVVESDLGSRSDDPNNATIVELSLSVPASMIGLGCIDWIRFASPYTSDSIPKGGTNPNIYVPMAMGASMGPSGYQRSVETISKLTSLLELMSSPDESPPDATTTISPGQVQPSVSTLSAHSTTVSNGDGTFTTTAHVGEDNVWNGTQWVRYVYNPDQKYVKIGHMIIYHNTDGTLRIENDTGSRLATMRWYAQAYFGGRWNNVTLDNYEFVRFRPTTDSISATQRFWSSREEMNITYTYSYLSGFKVNVTLRNLASVAVPARVVWAATDISGLAERGFSLLRQDNTTVIGVRIDNACISWADVVNTSPGTNIALSMDRTNGRASVTFGNMSNVVSPGSTWTIDPTYSIPNGQYDNGWHENLRTLVWYNDGSQTTIRIYTYDDGMGGGSYYISCWAVTLTDIPKYAVISSATAYVDVSSIVGGGITATVYRLDYADCPNLQNFGSTPPNFDSSISTSLALTSTGWKSISVTSMVQKQVLLSGWNMGQKMGLWYSDNDPSGSGVYSYMYAYEYGTSYAAYLTVTWTPDQDTTPPTLYNPGPSSVFIGQTVRFSVRAYDKSGIGTANSDVRLDYQFPGGSVVTKYRNDLQTDGNGKWWYDVACGSQTGQGSYTWTVYDNDNSAPGDQTAVTRQYNFYVESKTRLAVQAVARNIHGFRHTG